MDRRITRTQDAFMGALTQLMRQHLWDDINIQQICDTANIARSTFYTHFNNKQELLDLCFSNLESGLSESFPGRGLAVNGTFRFLPWLLRHVEANQDVFRLNVNSNSGQVIFSRFKFVVDRLASSELDQSPYAKCLSGDHITFINGGVFAMLERWNRNGGTPSSDDLLARIDALVSATLAMARG